MILNFLFLINLSFILAGDLKAKSVLDCRKLLYRSLNKDQKFVSTIRQFDFNIHPSQFQVSELVIKNKVNKILQMNMRQLQQYLDIKTIPFVFGPDGKYWIIDRHHTSRSLILARDILHKQGMNTKNLKVKFVMIKDWSSLSTNEFFDKMLEHKFIYPKRNGENVDPHELPEKLSELTNDPYRSLAWLIRTGNAYTKVSQPFLEFIWGGLFT